MTFQDAIHTYIHSFIHVVGMLGCVHKIMVGSGYGIKDPHLPIATQKIQLHLPSIHFPGSSHQQYTSIIQSLGASIHSIANIPQSGNAINDFTPVFTISEHLAHSVEFC